MSEGMDGDSRVALAEIRGDMKLVLAGQERANSDIRDLRNTIQGHSQRIGALEAKDNRAEGERAGVSLAVKALWTLGGGGAVALAAIIARALGA